MKMRYLFTVLLFLMLAVAIGGTSLWLQARPEVEWTSVSPQARGELVEALEDMQRVYWVDATQHLERALELDPDFVAAKVFLLQRLPRPERERLIEDLRGVDSSPLTERERFLLEHTLARFDRRREEADALLADYLARFADDPFALQEQCNRLTAKGQVEEQLECLTDLVAKYPNWAIAQNQLGYLAMAQGRFGDSEQHFLTYRFIAPDQANPHDSIGELMLLTGRYEEAEQAFRQALAVKPDFCASYHRLATTYRLTGRYQDGLAIFSEMDAHPECKVYWINGIGNQCALPLWALFDEGRYEEAWGRLGECAAGFKEHPMLPFRLALATDREAEAEEILQQWRQRWEQIKSKEGNADLPAPPLLLHMEGVMALWRGQPDDAVEFLQQVDEKIVYSGSHDGIFKLYNRVALAQALERSGRVADAATLRQQITAVNPHFLAASPQVELRRRAR